MAIPVSLLISATRALHSLSLRRASGHLKMAFTTLAALENFLYPPPQSLAAPLTHFFYSYPPPGELFPIPPSDLQISHMIRRDAFFHALIPFLEGPYHALSSMHRIGTLFLALIDIFVQRDGSVLRILAPQNPQASWALRHLFRRWWGSLKRQETLGVRFYPPLSPDEPYAASFEVLGGGGVNRIFFPEQEGQDCYFPHLVLYVLLKRLAFSFALDLRRAQESIQLARGPLEAARRTEGLLAPDQVAKLLRQTGSPQLILADALVLHGPQGDVTLLSADFSSEGDNWLALGGDILGTIEDGAD